MKIKKFNESFSSGISNYNKPITVKDMKDYLNDLPLIVSIYQRIMSSKRY